MTHPLAQKVQAKTVPQWVDDLHMRSGRKFVDVRERMAAYLRWDEYPEDRFNYYFRRPKPSTAYDVTELLALVHAYVVDLAPHERCRAEDAFALFQMANIHRNDFKLLQPFFPGQEFRAAGQHYLYGDFFPGAFEKVPEFVKPVFPEVFVGRDDDMAALKARLGVGSDGRRHPITVIQGWPGVGKTTVINRLVNDREKELEVVFPDGVLWTSLGPTGDVRQALKKWARQLGVIQVESLHTLGEITDTMRHALRDKQVLLVIDDVWHQQQADVFKQLQTGDVMFLFTTRFNDLGLTTAETRSNFFVLPVLTVEHSIELIDAFAPDATAEYPTEIRELVEMLEGLPLALRVAARLLEEAFFFEDDVGGLFNDLKTNFRSFQDLAPADRFDETLGQTPTIGLLFRRSVQTLTPDDQAAFACAGGFNYKPAQFGLSEFEEICGLTNAEATLKTLFGRGLLERLGNQRFQMHYTLAMYAHHLLDTGLAELDD